VPDTVTGALVAPYGDGWLLIVGTRPEPVTATDAVLVVRAELDQAGVLVPAPAAQAAPPAVPVLSLLPPDTEPAAAEEPFTAPGDPEPVLRRVRGAQVPLTPGPGGSRRPARLAAIGTLDLPPGVRQLDPNTPVAEAGPELVALRDRVDRVIIDLAHHEVGGRFPAAS